MGFFLICFHSHALYYMLDTCKQIKAFVFSLPNIFNPWHYCIIIHYNVKANTNILTANKNSLYPIVTEKKYPSLAVQLLQSELSIL